MRSLFLAIKSFQSASFAGKSGWVPRVLIQHIRCRLVHRFCCLSPSFWGLAFSFGVSLCLEGHGMLNLFMCLVLLCFMTSCVVFSTLCSLRIFAALQYDSFVAPNFTVSTATVQNSCSRVSCVSHGQPASLFDAKRLCPGHGQTSNYSSSIFVSIL